jgi:hypothetical protein
MMAMKSAASMLLINHMAEAFLTCVAPQFC